MTRLPQFLIAKYVPDVSRWEPRNVGLILWSQNGLRTKFVGEKETGSASIDGRSIPFYVKSHHAYRQWVKYWTDLASEEQQSDNCVSDPTECLKRFKETAAGNFLLEEGGFVWDNVDFEDLDELVNQLFSRLVFDRAADESKEISLSSLTRQIFERAQIVGDTNFKDNFSLSVVADDKKTVNLRFSHAYRNGSLNLFQEIPLTKNPEPSDKVFSTAFKFEKAIAAEAVDKDHNYSLIYAGQAEQSLEESLEVLSSVSQVFNLRRDDDQNRLLEKLSSLHHSLFE